MVSPKGDFNAHIVKEGAPATCDTNIYALSVVLAEEV